MSKRDVNETWADYLRRAMTEAGYEPDGVRSGGRTRLSEDSGVSLPVISRSLNEGRTPDPATLRLLAGPLGKTYRELLIKAGHATEADLPAPGADGSVSTAKQDADIEVLYRLPPGLSPRQRETARRLAQQSVQTYLDSLREE